MLGTSLDYARVCLLFRPTCTAYTCLIIQEHSGPKAFGARHAFLRRSENSGISLEAGTFSTMRRG